MLVFCSLLPILFSLALGQQTGSGTKFKKCGKAVCFDIVLEEIVVQVGKQGTDDDVVLNVCSDIKATECCTTPALKSRLSDDWSSNDKEKWGEKYFGQCRNKTITVKEGLSTTLSKSVPNKGVLNITSIDIYTKSPEKTVKEKERFQCKSFLLDTKNGGRQQKLCKTGPYTYQQIKGMQVKMGKDGTDDNVQMEVCSDVNGVCCKKKLSHTLRDDWKRNSVENWPAKEFGECAKIKFKIVIKPIVKIIKDGADNLIVDNMNFSMHDSKNVETKFTCGGVKLEGQCKKQPCKHTFNCNTAVLNSRRPSGSLAKGGGFVQKAVQKLETKSLKIATMTAKIGSDGTDDEVTMKICSDVNKLDCCASKLDKGKQKKEWQKDKTEMWEARAFTNCKDKQFQIKNGPLLSISKVGTDNLDVKSIDFYMKTRNQDQTRFACEGFKLQGDCRKTNGCQYSFRDCKNCKLAKCGGVGRPASRPGTPDKRPTKPISRPTKPSNRPAVKPPLHVLVDQKIDKMIVNMGPEGTKDDVKIKICSADDFAGQDVCCTSDKLSHLLSREWVGNKTETWEAKKFGKACKKKVFRISTAPQLTIIKNGKNDMTVKSLDFIMKNAQNETVKTKYSCNGFSVTGDCTKLPNKICTKTLGACIKRN